MVEPLGRSGGVFGVRLLGPAGFAGLANGSTVSGRDRPGRAQGSDHSASSHRTGYMLLVFVKLPVLLILVGAVLWLKGLKYNRDWPSTRTCPLTF